MRLRAQGRLWPAACGKAASVDTSHLLTCARGVGAPRVSFVRAPSVWQATPGLKSTVLELPEVCKTGEGIKATQTEDVQARHCRGHVRRSAPWRGVAWRANGVRRHRPCWPQRSTLRERRMC